MRTMLAASTIAATLWVASAAVAAPPPSGGFDTGTCATRPARTEANGRLLVRTRADRSSIYSARADGSGLRRVTRPPAHFDDTYPVVSPSGRWIAFGRVHDPVVRVIVHDLRSARERQVLAGFKPPNVQPDIRWSLSIFSKFGWSPDGRWLAVSGGVTFPGTVLVHPDGTGARGLDTGGWLFREASFSPNGRCLIGQAGYQESPFRHFDGFQFAIVGARGGRPNVFTPGSCPGGFPGCGAGKDVRAAQWMPDGKGVLVDIGRYDRPPATPDSPPDEYDVVRMGLAGDRFRVLVRDATYPVLSPDGRKVAAMRHGRAVIARVGGGTAVTLPRRISSVLAWAPR